jgi:hypothetical protein
MSREVNNIYSSACNVEIMVVKFILFFSVTSLILNKIFLWIICFQCQ